MCMKTDLALNNPQRLRCHKSQQTNPRKQHVTFLRCSHLAFSRCVLFASMWYIHTVVLTQRGINSVSFFFVEDIWFPYDRFTYINAVHAIVWCCRYLFQLIRYCYQGMWTCHLVCRLLLLVKNTWTALFVFSWRQMPPVTCFRLWSRDSNWAGVFARSARSSA